ncbi:MAG TPA: hypothetical protein VMN99_13460 [Anaerolineales bacterium]|nr:hypothetical protein [Anaerolineales bacterium]
MSHALISPHEPHHQPIRPPMIYVGKQWKWEYKQVIRDLEKDTPPNEAELNKLGEEGWEMSGVAQQPPLIYFYFKCQIEK